MEKRVKKLYNHLMLIIADLNNIYLNKQKNTYE